MITVYQIHGTGSSPKDHWHPWLATMLEQRGCKVISPFFTTAEKQSLSVWLKLFQEHLAHLDENSVLVGHSLGVPFILNVLEITPRPIKAAFLVSGFYGLLNHPKYDPLVSSFADRDFNWEKIRKNCKRFFIFHADNDPYVQSEKAYELGRALHSEPIFIGGAGHFNTQSGYREFPELLSKIGETI